MSNESAAVNERVERLEARVRWLERDLAAARIRHGVLYQMLIDAGVHAPLITSALTASSAP